MSRIIDDSKYLNYLLQSLNIDELKQICKNFQIKGYSAKKKSELVSLILDSLAEEELKDLIKEKELEIISSEINIAIKKINGEDRESLVAIKIVNEKNHEVELFFKGFNWETSSYLSIRPETINDPDRDCDCRTGASMGFCNHFWVGFIFSLKQNYFKISDWNITVLPKDFDKMIQSIKISAPSSTGDTGLIDESSDTSTLMKLNGASVIVYEGVITDIVQRQSDFQGNITTYFHISLKDVRLGPKVTKKSDFNEEDIIDLKNLKLRISDKLQTSVKLANGDKITGSGKLEKDNFWGFLVKNVRKIDKI